MTPSDEAEADGSSSVVTRTDVHLIISIFLGSLIGVQAWDLSDVRPFDQVWGATPDGPESTAAIADVLFTQWAAPFEVLSVLLLVALVGALAIAVRDEGGGA